MYCLIKSEVEKLKRAIADGTLNPAKLSEMSSAESLAFLETILSKENAKQVNLLYEKKLLLKKQDRAIYNLFRDITGLSEKEKAVKAEEMKRTLAEKNRRIFEPAEGERILNELIADKYAKKYRTEVTLEESEKILDLYSKAEEAKKKINNESPLRSKDRVDYGVEQALYDDYIGELIHETKKIPLLDYNKPKNYGKAIVELGGLTKSFLSTFDNSFVGTQGAKMFYARPYLWAKGVIKSFDNIQKELRGKDAMLPIRADVLSRPNALNDAYKKAKLDVGIKTEEQFPIHLGAKIPLLGRIFRGSESAFNGTAMRMRADYFDKLYKWAESNGRDMNDKTVLEGLGSLANSMTGRGSLGKLEPVAGTVNNLLFSGKFLASNWNTLTAHLFDSKAPTFVKIEAAKNLMKIVGGTAAIITMYNFLHPGQEIDPRSSNFGKLVNGNKATDITGKMGSLVTLISRLIPTTHNGKWGFWTKNSKGEYRDLTDGKYGQATALDVFENFWEGKAAPLAGLMRDIWKGQNFEMEKVTPQSAIKSLVTPLSIQSILKLDKDTQDANNLIYAILDTLGFSTSVNVPKKTTPKKKVVPLIQ